MFFLHVNIVWVPTCFWSCLMERAFRKTILAYCYSSLFQTLQDVLFLLSVAWNANELLPIAYKWAQTLTHTWQWTWHGGERDCTPGAELQRQSGARAAELRNSLRGRHMTNWQITHLFLCGISLLLKCTNISDQRSTAGPQKAVSNYNDFVHSEMLTYFKVSLRVETPEAQKKPLNPKSVVFIIGHL